jgi:hypothetical protein
VASGALHVQRLVFGVVFGVVFSDAQAVLRQVEYLMALTHHNLRDHPPLRGV